MRCGLREVWVCCGHSSARHRLPAQVDFPSSVSSRLEPAPRQVELKTPLRINRSLPGGAMSQLAEPPEDCVPFEGPTYMSPLRLPPVWALWRGGRSEQQPQ